MNLILCGMMGAGKTSVGMRLAERTGRRWVDTDELIEKKYGAISEIFRRFGEEYFRRAETETIRGLSGLDGLVISVGGGLVLWKENVSLLKENGKIVYLRASVQTLEGRLVSDTSRPLLKTEKPLSERLQEMLKFRAPIYEGAADFTIDTDGKTVSEIVDEILSVTDENK